MHFTKPFVLFFGCVSLLLLTSGVILALKQLRNLNSAPHLYHPIKPGALVDRLIPSTDSGRSLPAPSPLRQAVLQHWAQLPAQEPLPKVNAPRVLLARLILNQDLPETNQLIRLIQPWAASGSEWDLREFFGFSKNYSDPIRLGHRGDYDFTTVTLSSILGRFKEHASILYPETVQWMVSHQFPDQHSAPLLKVPRSFGLVSETENHVLMTESTRYLCHSFLGPTPSTHRSSQWLIQYLKNLQQTGFREFNSIPYQGFSFQALLNLEAHAPSTEIRDLARHILDQANWQYALGSYRLRRAAPFRRQPAYAREIFLSADPQSEMMAVWTDVDPGSLSQEQRQRILHSPHALVAAASTYALPQTLTHFLQHRRDQEYFVRMGRGSQGSPEIYSGGKEYLLSAGGCGRGESAEIVPRPITLLLEDGATRLSDCFHIPGAHPDLYRWNNTGVAHRLACGDHPVFIPETYKPEAFEESWKVFRQKEKNLFWVVFNTEKFGLIALFPDFHGSAKKLLQEVIFLNPQAQLTTSFHFPHSDRIIHYQVTAPVGIWVILPESKEQRAYDAWPQLDGWIAPSIP